MLFLYQVKVNYVAILIIHIYSNRMQKQPDGILIIFFLRSFWKMNIFEINFDKILVRSRNSCQCLAFKAHRSIKHYLTSSS